MLRKVWDKVFRGKAAAWTAIFTAFLTWTNVHLMNLQWAYVETTVAAQRAFINFDADQVSAEKRRVVRVLDKSGKLAALQIPIGWMNSGTTPTKVMVGVSNALPWATELPATFDFKDLSDSKPTPGIMGPKGAGAHVLVIPINHFADVIQRKYHLYSWGWVAYRDVLSGTPLRLTEYCVEFNNVRASSADLTDPTVTIQWQFVPCMTVEHNCYDEYCTDYQVRVSQVESQFPQMR